jgi:hypothetical protein
LEFLSRCTDASNLSRGFPRAPRYEERGTVSLVQGEQLRKNVTEPLTLIDDQIKPLLARKKYVVIKPNIVNTSIHLAATHADALLGIMDYLAPRFKGEVVIAESSAYDTLEGYDNGQVVEGRIVTDMPLNGRNVFALIAVAPGVIPQNDAIQSGTMNYQISGGMANQGGHVV